MKPQSKYSMLEKREFAKQMRENPTPAEAHLWTFLRKEQLGYRFWRQQLLQGYVVDFYCPRARVAVEVDGSVHELELQARGDKLRENSLTEKSIRLVRFGNEEVFAAPQLVLRKIRHECEARVAPLKAVVFDLKQDSLNYRRSRSLCKSRKFEVKACEENGLEANILEDVTANELRKLSQQIIYFARQKSFPFTNYDSRPVAEKVNDQRYRLQEWLRKRA